MMHRALRYVLRTRLRNGVARWFGKLRTPRGWGGAALIVLVLIGALFAGDWGAVSTPEREAIFTTLFGFLLYSGILGGLGQRGLVYSPADLDFVLPGPFPRRHLVVYQFGMHYLAAGIMSLVFLLVFGGRFLPHPFWFALGAFLLQVTSTHLATAAAETSMLIADRLFSGFRKVTMVLLTLVIVGGVALIVGGIAGWGDVPGRLRQALSSDVVRVLLYPAVEASALGVVDGWGERLAALGGLLACVAGSFALVLLIPADVVEGSYAVSRKVQKRTEEFKRGVFRATSKGSHALPRARWLRGAGAVFWLNAVALRRQLRTLLGGVFVAGVVFAVVGMRGAGDPSGTMPRVLLFLLVMVPLWMHLPIGFRLPREQLGAIRLLPVPPTPLAAALLGVPVLAPFGLQVAGAILLAATGLVPWTHGLLALPAFLAATATLLAVEASFSLRKSHPNAIDILQALFQVLTQILALMPGIVTLTGIGLVAHGTPVALLPAAAVQGAVAYTLLPGLGRRLLRHELAGETG